MQLWICITVLIILPLLISIIIHGVNKNQIYEMKINGKPINHLITRLEYTNYHKTRKKVLKNAPLSFNAERISQESNISCADLYMEVTMNGAEIVRKEGFSIPSLEVLCR